LLDSAPERPCLIAETARAAAILGPLDGPGHSAILLDDPAWSERLRARAPGVAILAIEDGQHLAELVALADHLSRFDRVEIHFVGEIGSDLEADIIDLYATRTVTDARGRVRFAERRPQRWVPNPQGRRAGPLLDGMLSGLRVAFTSNHTLRRLGGAVDAVLVYESAERSLSEQVGGWVNVLVVDASVPGHWGGIVEEARTLGAKIFVVGEGIPDQVQADLILSDENLAARCVPPEVTPVGFRRVVGARLAVVGSMAAARPGVESLMGVLGEVVLSPGVDLFGSVKGLPLPAGMSLFPGGLDQALITRLRPYAGVIDHPALHETVIERAESLMTLAAAGVPIAAVAVDDRLGELIGEEMASLIGSASVTQLADPESRDRLSVQLRRIARHQGSQTTTWRHLAGSMGITVAPLPTISVLLASNRPDFVDHALSQVSMQTYPQIELVLILHGDAFQLKDSEMRDRYPRPLQILRLPSTVVYGEALNRGTATSTGTLIAKMDDDDWYSPHHLWDLAHAMDYSNADLVGKAAEFVYLEELDLTLRRMPGGGETYGNRSLAGGSFLIRKEALHRIGGWRRVPINEDRGTIEDVLAIGGVIYRAHGHGYLLNRHVRPHLWEPGSAYFLNHAASTRPGVDHAWAMTGPE
jgi:hypothetical protein